ncbi:Adenylate cyclase [Labilithrix luteola]|uniref:Adenylate cyclase n=1 Tax=Labilithrix luteola TaxID=1391654 RepID=A0A0K1QAY2_9BACT|nr:formylglycine-generating enzyme family protein [Labilithrix luteola]AKV02893.1 Adenylate cyclase [Labilithrix luteola]
MRRLPRLPAPGSTVGAALVTFSVMVLVGIAPACSPGEREQLPPYGNVVMVVDTDLPVPCVVSRLRIDAYAADGRWIASRDDLRPDARDWPTSFGLFTDDTSNEHILFVRLRAYLDGRLVPYTGRVRAELAELVRAIPKGDGHPRLVVDGVDRTPLQEPNPLVTVDRLIRVRLTPGKQARARVMLHGACVGRMPIMDELDTAASCVGESSDDPTMLVPVEDVPLESLLDVGLASTVGTFSAELCPDGADPTNPRVCIPGGVFVFGDAFFVGASERGASADTSPERIVQIARFAIDRDEVSVARYRSALERGFVPPTDVSASEHDGPPGTALDDSCTFSVAPRGREDYPLSCVPWETADAFCRFEGGALPTEAQWEYAALAAGRASKTLYPWGDDAPRCDRAVYGRSSFGPDCTSSGEGLLPLGSSNDVTASGVRDLAGGLSEYVLDSAASFRDECWVEASLQDPVCSLPPPPECADPKSLECRVGPGIVHGVRGGNWTSVAAELRPIDRSETVRVGSGGDGLMGFRCVYSAP